MGLEDIMGCICKFWGIDEGFCLFSISTDLERKIA